MSIHSLLIFICLFFSCSGFLQSAAFVSSNSPISGILNRKVPDAPVKRRSGKSRIIRRTGTMVRSLFDPELGKRKAPEAPEAAESKKLRTADAEMSHEYDFGNWDFDKVLEKRGSVSGDIKKGSYSSTQKIDDTSLVLRTTWLTGSSDPRAEEAKAALCDIENNCIIYKALKENDLGTKDGIVFPFTGKMLPDDENRCSCYLEVMDDAGDTLKDYVSRENFQNKDNDFKDAFYKGVIDSLSEILKNLADRAKLAHLDVTLSNIMIGEDGKVSLIDWQMASRLGEISKDCGDGGYFLYNGLPDSIGVKPWHDPVSLSIGLLRIIGNVANLDNKIFDLTPDYLKGLIMKEDSNYSNYPKTKLALQDILNSVPESYGNAD